MNFRSVFPLIDSDNPLGDQFPFENCNSNEKFLIEIVRIYFESKESRVKDAALAVFQAYRDHYPKYLVSISKSEIKKLNHDIENSSGKIIKLRRIAINALAKIA